MKPPSMMGSVAKRIVRNGIARTAPTARTNTLNLNDKRALNIWFSPTPNQRSQNIVFSEKGKTKSVCMRH